MSHNPEALKKLIEENIGNESLCGDYLKYIPNMMLKLTYGYDCNDIKTSQEIPGYKGKSDFIISAKIGNPDSHQYYIYVWEIKAPYCDVFIKETNHRCQPSDILYKAENQLLNYFDEVKGSEEIRKCFSPPGGVIISSHNVKMGGIIIGRMDKRITGYDDIDSTEKERLYESAKKIRNYFYEPNQITLHTWDAILSEYQNKYIIGKTIDSKEKTLEIPKSTETRLFKIVPLDRYSSKNY